MEQIRAFIAIELPDEILQKLGRLEDQLRDGAGRVARWVKPESIHLTLKFLGEIDSGRVDEITSAMKAGARDIAPFTIAIKGTGVFPGVRQTRVAWVGLAEDIETLQQLQQNIESRLEPLGFKPDARGFTPHLTIARANEQASPEERRRFGETVVDTQFEGGKIRVEAISLIRSQLMRTGAVYSRLGEAALGRK